MGPFLNSCKVKQHKDGDVGNLQKFEHFYDYFRHSCYA